MADQNSYKLVANNKKAYHDYFIEEKYECGIELFGTEVKSIRMGKCSIKEAYVSVSGGEAYIEGMNISPYEKGNRFNTDPMRPKKLLLHKKEIRKLIGYISRDGLTLVPLDVYLDGRGRAKMTLAVARGKKLYDKREDLAKRDAERDMDRRVKNR